MIYCRHYFQPQLRRELVHSITGRGQRTKRDSFDTSKVDLSMVVEAIKMVLDVPDPLRQVLDSRHAVHNLYQHPRPLASLVSASVASTGVQIHLDLCLIFFCASACTFASSSTSLTWCRIFSKDGAKAES